MNIHIFQSHEGDCLMVEDAAGKHRILCDGGSEAAMRHRIAKELAQWAVDDKEIDLLYVSHIDADHIGGVFVMLDAMAQWKVYDINQADGDPSAEPELPRQPKVHNIWHNAFRDIVKDNVGKIESLLAASAPMLQASQVHELQHLGHDYAQIATSVPQAIKVSRLIKPDILDIGLNQLPNNKKHSGKLLMARDKQNDEQIGSLTVSILCPTQDELDNLRTGWNAWLDTEASQKSLEKARNYYAVGLNASNPFAQGNPIDLHKWNGVAAYKQVTAPNVASTVLMVEEEDGKRLLLTGDNHPDMIVAGLEYGGYLDNGYVHVDVLKYPHHGSEHNITSDFSRQVSADHYIFCGNGSSGNPDLRVLEQMIQARVGPAKLRALAPKAKDRPFTFWFSTSPKAANTEAFKLHMKNLADWARKMEAKHGNVFSARFSDEPYITLAP